MVYDLMTLKRMNAVKAKKVTLGHNEEMVPKHLRGSVIATRRFLNRPWTREELKGKPSVYETYAESNKAPFKGKDVLVG